MPARRSLPEDAAERLKTAMKKAKTKDECRRVLCVWLRQLGFRSRQVAAMMMWSTHYVRHVHSRYLREGEAAFEMPGPERGGRRRRWLLKREDENTLFRRLREEAWPNGTLEFRTLHQAVEKAVGRPVDAAVVHRMLKRHGWGRQVIVAIARQKYPKDMPTGIRSPRKDRFPRTGVWQLLREDPVEWKPVLQKIHGVRGSG